MPKKNAVVDSNAALGEGEDLNIPSLDSICISVHNSEDKIATIEAPTRSQNSVNFAETHSVEEIVLEEFGPHRNASSSASKTSMSSGGSDNRSQSMQSVSSIGSVASQAVGTSVSIKPAEEHKMTIKEIIKSLPSLFFGKNRPSFLLVLLVFMAFAVAAPAASTLILVT